MNTKLVFAYRGGTLANVHTLCSSAFVAANQNAIGNCSGINGWYTLATVTMWGGLALAGIGVTVSLIRRKAA